MTTRQNRYSQTLEFYYQGEKLTMINDPLSGKQLLFQYGQNNLLTSVNDSAGRQVNFSYDASNYLTGINNNGHNTNLEYDSEGHLLKETDPIGQTVFTNTYDTEGRVISQTDGKGQTMTFTYQETYSENNTDTYQEQHITTVTDRNGKNKT